MSPGRSPHFEITHQTVLAGGLTGLRLELELRLIGPTGVESPHWFRVDTGADVSMITESVAFGLGLRLDPWPSSRTPRAATGSPMRCRLARGVRYEFEDFRGFRFRTDFAVSPDLTRCDGLLAWRDLASDFDVRTTILPRRFPGGTALGVPGTVRFTLRNDRFLDRIG